MNNLTFYLYLADVLGNISVAFVAVPCIIAFAALLFMAVEEKWSYVKHLGWLLIPLFIALLIPSATTRNLMILSELGEEVILNPEVGEIFNDLKDVLQIQLDKMKVK